MIENDWAPMNDYASFTNEAPCEALGRMDDTVCWTWPKDVRVW